MKFLCDVHISHKIVSSFHTQGFEAIHVNSILLGSVTPDNQICRYADEHGFILISKDADFRNSYFIQRTPQKLIRICLGNISTNELIKILQTHIQLLKSLDNEPSFLIEIDKDSMQKFS